MPVKTELKEKRSELEAKQKKLHEVFEQAGDEMDLDQVTAIEGDTQAKAETIRKMNDELGELMGDIEKLVELVNAEEESKRRDEIVNTVVEREMKKFPEGGEITRKTIGQMIGESEAYKGIIGEDGRVKSEGPAAMIDIPLKTLFETTAGWAPETTRTGLVVPIATRPIQVTDILPSGNTQQAAIVYMEETTFTNTAAETAEGGQYPEATLELTEQTSPVRKIAVFIPVTDEQLADEAQVSSYLDQRLQFMLRQRLDGQILTGDGIAPNLTGILNVPGIQTQALGGDPVPDAFYKAMDLVIVTGRAMPSHIIIHPTDWQAVRLLRTTDGIYIWGSPSEPGPERMWGLPVVKSDAITLNTGLVGDFNQFIQLYERAGIEVKISDSHSDFFIKGKKAVRADVRVAMPVYRPAAFCSVTGI
jgi:HK97 family phage major capsid protein